MKSSVCITLGLLLCASGCTTPVTEADVAQANFGSRVQSELALRLVQEWLQPKLIDPQSLQLECSEPQRGWGRTGMLNEPPSYGYITVCNVNAKNSFGGYTGAKPYLFIVNSDVRHTVVGKEYLYPPTRGTDYAYVPEP